MIEQPIFWGRAFMQYWLDCDYKPSDAIWMAGDHCELSAAQLRDLIKTYHWHRQIYKRRPIDAAEHAFMLIVQWQQTWMPFDQRVSLERPAAWERALMATKRWRKA